MKKKSIARLLYEELQLLFYDKWILFTATLLPAVLFATILTLFQQGVVKELPIAIVDMDCGRFSRMLIRNYDASSQLHVVCYPNMKQAVNDLRRGKVYGIISIPTEMEKKSRLGLSPKVSAFYNFQFILVGKALKSAVAMAHATFNAQIASSFGLRQGNIQLVQTKGNAITTQKQITPLYNRNLNYGQFLATALIPTIWQIVMVAVTILIWAAEERRNGLTHWLRNQTIPKLCIRFGFYQCIFLLQGAAFIAAFTLHGWPIRGSVFVLYIAQGLTALACLGIGTLLFLIIPDPTRLLSLATSYVAPSFAFLGVTFPVSDMSSFARVWHSILPISHYIKIQIGVINYGASFTTLLPHFQKLCYFLCLFILITLSVYRRIKK